MPSSLSVRVKHAKTALVRHWELVLVVYCLSSRPPRRQSRYCAARRLPRFARLYSDIGRPSIPPSLDRPAVMRDGTTPSSRSSWVDPPDHRSVRLADLSECAGSNCCCSGDDGAIGALFARQRGGVVPG